MALDVRKQLTELTAQMNGPEGGHPQHRVSELSDAELFWKRGDEVAEHILVSPILASASLRPSEQPSTVRALSALTPIATVRLRPAQADEGVGVPRRWATPPTNMVDSLGDWIARVVGHVSALPADEVDEQRSACAAASWELRLSVSPRPRKGPFFGGSRRYARGETHVGRRWSGGRTKAVLCLSSRPP